MRFGIGAWPSISICFLQRGIRNLRFSRCVIRNQSCWGWTEHKSITGIILGALKSLLNESRTQIGLLHCGLRQLIIFRPNVSGAESLRCTYRNSDSQSRSSEYFGECLRAQQNSRHQTTTTMTQQALNNGSIVRKPFMLKWPTCLSYVTIS